MKNASLTPAIVPLLAAAAGLAVAMAAGAAAGCSGAPRPDSPATPAPAVGRPTEFLKGADLSMLPLLERAGAVYRFRGKPVDPVRLLGRHGVNLVRLRLLHSPTEGHGELAATLAMAERARAAGCRVLLAFHYSDTWADPGHQTRPAAWRGADDPALADSVRSYTRTVLETFRERGVPPDIVQLGNEITSGILWDTGRVGGAFDTPAQWARLGRLLAAAAGGVEDAFPGGTGPERMIHIDRGGDPRGARRFFASLEPHFDAFDIVGVSYYPWWHGDLTGLEETLQETVAAVGRDVLVVETAYPWTTRWFDDTDNIVGPDQAGLPGYAATPRDQARFLRDVLRIVRNAPGGHGRGVCWWAPEWIAAGTYGSVWENVTLFDESGRTLPALQELRN